MKIMHSNIVIVIVYTYMMLTVHLLHSNINLAN